MLQRPLSFRWLERPSISPIIAAMLLIDLGARSRRLVRSVALAGLAAAAGAQAVMVASPKADTVGRPETLADWPEPDLRGVARLSNGCSAVLLEGGRYLLGAAHCAGAAGATAVLGSGETVSVAAVHHAPGWAGQAAVHDLALMALAAPASAGGYGLASADLVKAMPAVLVAGFGGSGTPGAAQPPGSLRHGYNEYDATFWPAGVPVPADGPRIRLFDFDDGSFAHNTLGLRPGGVSSLGLGPSEAMLAGMDSGGPSLVPVKVENWRSRWLGASPWRWKIAGIHVGIDGSRGSAFGGIGMDLMVGPYQGWIVGITGTP
jgi:hypothetical protein